MNTLEKLSSLSLYRTIFVSTPETKAFKDNDGRQTDYKDIEDIYLLVRKIVEVDGPRDANVICQQDNIRIYVERGFSIDADLIIRFINPLVSLASQGKIYSGPNGKLIISSYDITISWPSGGAMDIPTALAKADLYKEFAILAAKISTSLAICGNIGYLQTNK